MRQVTLGTTGIATSCLGFGCASLGSRVGPEPGLRALEAAFEAGVTWLDLAPLYGAGQAEAIAGRFLAGKPREAVQICSKVGLAAGVAPHGLKAALMPLARAAVAAVPSLRGVLRRGGAQPAAALPLTPELLAGSLEASLRRLGTDHLDLYALHGVAADALTDEVRRCLEDLRAAGKTRAVAVAGDAGAARAAIAIGAPFGAVQVALTAPGAPEDGLLAAARAAGLGSLVHSVLGIDGSLAGLKARAAADPGFRAALMAGGAGAGDLERALGQRLLARAFALNPDGVVLVSMFSPRSLTAARAAAALPPDPAAATLPA